MDNLMNQQQQETPKKQWIEPEMEVINLQKGPGAVNYDTTKFILYTKS